MDLVDIFRSVVIIAVLLAAATFPAAIRRQGRPSNSAWVAVVATELLLLSATAAISDNYGRPLVWYRTPIAFVSAVLYLIFVIYTYTQGRS